MQLEVSNSCRLCPRQCGVDRFNKEEGYCRCSDNPLVSSVFLHRGEEPVISGTKGICNVFFAHCNLRCEFCQNYQISRNDTFNPEWLDTYDSVVSEIKRILDQDIRLLGFVSPSHQVFQMVEIINRLNRDGYKPTIVYNSNGYDSVDTLRMLDGIVDVYLPDFKYCDNNLGRKYSDVPDYFDVVSKALKEMYRQKGSPLFLDENGLVESGIVIRHLVLPGYSDDSINILEYIANEISSNLHISLMSQYYPTCNVKKSSQINRTLSQIEYGKVVDRLEELGFKGWAQELDSSTFYRPNFLSDSPFGE